MEVVHLEEHRVTVVLSSQELWAMQGYAERWGIGYDAAIQHILTEGVEMYFKGEE